MTRCICSTAYERQGCCELACNTLVRVSNGSFHGIQSAMPRTAGVSGNVPVGKGYKNAGIGGLPAK